MKRYPLVIVLFTVFIDLLGFGIVLPILPYHAQTFGASSVQIGAIIAAFSLMQFLFTPVWGRVSDRVGRRPVILVSLFGSVASYVQFANAETPLTILASRMLAGIAGANLAAAQAYIADVTPPEKRARGMGWVSAAFGLGFMLGPPFAALAAQKWGVHAPGYLAAGLAMLNFILAYFWLPESVQAHARAPERRALDLRAIRKVFTDPVLGAVSLTMTAVALATSGITAMLALFLQARFRFGPSDAAWIFSMMGLTTAVVQLFGVHVLVRRYGEREVAVGGIVLLTLASVLFPLAGDVWTLRAVVLFYALAFAVIGPSAMSLVSQATEVRDQGQVIGVVQSFGSLARVIGPMTAGLAFSRLGIGAPFFAASIVCALASVYMWQHSRRITRAGQPAQQPQPASGAD